MRKWFTLRRHFKVIWKHACRGLFKWSNTKLIFRENSGRPWICSAGSFGLVTWYREYVGVFNKKRQEPVVPQPSGNTDFSVILFVFLRFCCSVRGITHSTTELETLFEKVY